jgi:ferric-dicitrate binding protein FerR (iron transport regulator)
MANTKDHGERDLKGGRKLRRAAMLLLGITLLVSAPLALAADATPRLLGTVVASGKASMKARLDRWVPVDEKTFPVVDGTALKTGDGTMAITMKDGASIEIGKKTDLVVSGAVSNYFMRLQQGTIAFKIYEGMGLSVTTPSTSVVVQRVSGTIETTRHTVKDEISGIIIHDGKETQVFCQRGKFGVMQASAETMILSEGNRVAVQDPLAGTQAPTATLPESAGRPSSPKVVFYESPNADVIPSPSTSVLQNVATGGLEVVSESSP